MAVIKDPLERVIKKYNIRVVPTFFIFLVSLLVNIFSGWFRGSTILRISRFEPSTSLEIEYLPIGGYPFVYIYDEVSPHIKGFIDFDYIPFLLNQILYASLLVLVWRVLRQFLMHKMTDEKQEFDHDHS